PPPWTDAHHREHWADGGATSLANLVLLCRRHHRLLHEGGWSLAGDANGTLTAHPPDPAGAASRRTGRAPPGMAA
ncbi:MAG: HNH endonuclease, partial [Actinomycetota bacterium]|nr:HNH endonuclease [Actinomycetota bacterium]